MLSHHSQGRLADHHAASLASRYRLREHRRSAGRGPRGFPGREGPDEDAGWGCRI